MLREDEVDYEVMLNLLRVYYELMRLRNIRDDVMEQISRGDDLGLRVMLEDYFERLDGVVRVFDERIELIVMSLIMLVQVENESLVVRFVLIVEVEEKSDQRVMVLQEVLKDYREIVMRFQSIIDGVKIVRGYKERFLECIKDVVVLQFEKSRQEFMGDLGGLEKSLRWYFNDLNMVRLGMEQKQLMLRKWKIFKMWVVIFYQMMYDFLIGIVEDLEMSSSYMLEIVGWLEKYYRKMLKLGFKQEELGVQVIDNREMELVRDFRQFIIKFLDEWIDWIWVVERKDFVE